MTDPIRVLFPVGMLGGGFPPETVTRGIELGADIIAVDGGSTDSGPHYLGTATAKTARAAVERDLRVLVPAAHDANIPLVVGSCGTSGCDAGVEWIYEIVQRICADLGISRMNRQGLQRTGPRPDRRSARAGPGAPPRYGRAAAAGDRGPVPATSSG